MDYFNYKINTAPELSEILLAFLGELPFNTFKETEAGLEAYIAEVDYSDAVHEEILRLAEQFNFEFEKEQIAAKNWNQEWESNFHPIIVGDFCGIRADFHPTLTQVKHEIIINPKMAFGTGHHATTFMMIEQMKALDFNRKNVFDYGCGTGVLAILAAKLGAESIQAVDIEAASFENTLENSKINNVANIHCVHGTLADIETESFDVILANINRNVILDSLATLYKKLLKNGRLIVSGFIEKDQDMLLATATQLGFDPIKVQNKDNWISIAFSKI